MSLPTGGKVPSGLKDALLGALNGAFGPSRSVRISRLLAATDALGDPREGTSHGENGMLDDIVLDPDPIRDTKGGIPNTLALRHGVVDHRIEMYL